MRAQKEKGGKRRKKRKRLTDDGEVDESVASLRESEIDSAAVESLVFGFDVGEEEDSGMTVRSECGALAQHITAR